MNVGWRTSSEMYTGKDKGSVVVRTQVFNSLLCHPNITFVLDY